MRRRWQAALTYANLAPFIFFALFPFYFMFVTSDDDLKHWIADIGGLSLHP